MMYYFSSSPNIANQQDSLAKDTSLRDLSLRTQLLNAGLKKTESAQDSIIQLIQEGYDATSYYYVQSEKTASITDYFLNPKYFPVRDNKFFSESKAFENKGVTQDTFALKQSDFLLLVLLGLAALIAYVRFTTHDYLKRITASVFSFAYSRTLYNDRSKLLLVKDFILQIVFFISSGILALDLAFYFNLLDEQQTSVSLYFFFPLLVFGLILFYRIFIWLLGMLSDTVGIVSEYLYYFSNSLKFLGIFNVIVLFALLFGSQSIQVYVVNLSFFVYISIYIIRVYKIFYEFLNNRFSLFYLILYFCALEIVPIMMLFKQISILSGTGFVF